MQAGLPDMRNQLRTPVLRMKGPYISVQIVGVEVGVGVGVRVGVGVGVGAGVGVVLL